MPRLVTSDHVRVLVTGGAGFIGSGLVRDLVLQDQIPVCTLDALTYAGHRESLVSLGEDPLHSFIHGDIADGPLLARTLADFRPTAILHLAAETHVDRSIDGPAPFLRTNVAGTLMLLEQTLSYWRGLSPTQREQFRLVHVSTDEVYGALGPEGKFTELSPYSPNSPYAASKAAADHFVRAYHRTYGLPTIVTNCSNNYGPFQYPEKLIPLMILNALEGSPLPVYGDGQQVRDWLFVSDHTRALRMVLERGQAGQTYNIGGGTELTNLQVVTRICRAIDECCPHLPHLPCDQLITFVEDRPGHDWRYALDASFIARELGWHPLVEFDSGIRQTVQWYLSNHAWLAAVLKTGQHRQRLGLSADG